MPAVSGSVFGTKPDVSAAISPELLQEKIVGNTHQLIPVTVKGEVVSVCQMEGCWLKIKSTKGDIMVRMNDHAFFVPIAIHNKMIVVEGVAEEKITSVETLKHYAEDAGKSTEEIEAITTPKKEILILAKGIEVI